VTIENLKLTTEQLEIYQTLLRRTGGHEEWSRRVLFGGHPDQMQGDMALECAAVATGRHWGAPYEGPGPDPWAQVFRKSSSQWRLLLQVPTVERIGMMWGDAGCLYYWIRDDDLNAQRFERCWLILQCG
jgi:uncharacterized protein YwqG